MGITKRILLFICLLGLKALADDTQPAKRLTTEGQNSIVNLNLDFEQGKREGFVHPKVWGGGGKGYDVECVSDTKHSGTWAAEIKKTGDGKFATLTGMIAPEIIAGKRVKLSGWLKLENVTGFAGFWLRADMLGIAPSFTNMQQDQIKGTRDWQLYGFEIDIPEDTTNVNFGALLVGDGTVWVDDISLAIIGPAKENRQVPKEDKKKIDAALAASQKWLALTDASDYEKGWNGSAPFFQKNVSLDEWQTSMTQFRKPLGKVVKRRPLNARVMTELPGAPKGQYVIIQYKTDFANRKVTVETITPMLVDGVWKVSGYYLK